VSEEEEEDEEEESGDGEEEEEDDRRKGPKTWRARPTPQKRARPRATGKRQLKSKVSARSKADPSAESTQETDVGMDEEEGEQKSLFGTGEASALCVRVDHRLTGVCYAACRCGPGRAIAAKGGGKVARPL
jgi:hypothetical protein